MNHEAQPLTWTQRSPGDWEATGHDGADWEIVQQGDRFGIIIARWDKPDWYAPTLEEAMAMAPRDSPDELAAGQGGHPDRVV